MAIIKIHKIIANKIIEFRRNKENMSEIWIGIDEEDLCP